VARFQKPGAFGYSLSFAPGFWPLRSGGEFDVRQHRAMARPHARRILSARLVLCRVSMTGRVPKICGRAGCPKLCPSGTRYCPEHTKERNWAGASGRPRSRNIPDSVKLNVLRRDGFLCTIRYEDICEGYATDVDHITPVSEGGGDELTSLASACRSCHRRKSSQEAHRAQGHNVGQAPPRSVGAPGAPGAKSPQPSESWTPRTIHLM
jgi:5-methylcytosine-specific restriction enzyme A